MIVKGINRLFYDKIILEVKIMKSKKESKKISSANPTPGDSFDAADMLNKYGTYNIQPTANTQNLFPQISQGLPSGKCRNSNRKKRVDS